MNFDNEYKLIKDEIIAVRRLIHQNPELGFEEENTAQTICSVLDKYDISYQKGIAKTGICACIGTTGDKVLLIRADIDALPTEEKTGLPYASKKSGVMHACGHDIHIASALAAAIVLKKHEKELKGSVKIVFQPAEETTGGAKPMIDEGILNNPKVTAAIGGHVSPEFKTGTVKVKPGALMASPDDFMIKFIGKSAHGAEPQNGINPIIPAAEFASEINNKAKTLCKDGNVLSICTLSSDGGVNTIPDEALILGTFRSFDEDSRNNASELLCSFAEEKARKFGAKIEYKYNFLYPPVINDNKMTEDLISIAQKALGAEKVLKFDKSLMTGDDFSYFGKYVPSVYFWYGADSGNSAPLHSSQFIADEDAIKTCAKVFCEFTNWYLG